MTIASPSRVLVPASLLFLAGCCTDNGRDDAKASPGQVSSVAVEHDVRVSLADVPAAVRATIQAHLNGGTIDEIERSSDGGRVTYDVEVESANGDFEFEVAPDGTFLGMDGEENDGADDGDESDDH